MKKQYRGSLVNGEPVFHVIEQEQRGLYHLRPLIHIVRHSPTGMGWGYAGSGPADLAIAILSDYSGSEPAPRVYQDFKREFVARWPMDDSWTLTSEEIAEWFESRHLFSPEER